MIIKKEYNSKRYEQWVIVEQGFVSDGATGAIDIDSKGWWVHDKLCETGIFFDGSECTNWQASMILSDILAEEGRWFRANTWFIMTWLFGGGRARDKGVY